MTDCKRRQWKPIKPSVLARWQSALHNHVLPVLGDLPLSDVKNGAMRTLVERLFAKRLKPSSIRAITQVVKAVVGSAEDADGNQLYPVVWNRKFAPIINPATQHRPTFTTDEIQKLVDGTNKHLQLAVIVLASTGLRIGELLGLECKHFDGVSLRISQAVWCGIIQSPKTINAYRTVDLTPPVAALLRGYIGDRTSGYIFESRTGRPINARNFLRSLYSNLERVQISKRGFHAFRRFRNTHLRSAHCQPGLLRYWMGHSGSCNMSDLYDRSFEDATFRRDVANKVGVGFLIPESLAARQPKSTAPAQPKEQEWALTGVDGGGRSASTD